MFLTLITIILIWATSRFSNKYPGLIGFHNCPTGDVSLRGFFSGYGLTLVMGGVMILAILSDAVLIMPILFGKTQFSFDTTAEALWSIWMFGCLAFNSYKWLLLSQGIYILNHGGTLIHKDEHGQYKCEEYIPKR